MGWIGSDDTQAQVRLNFASREDAIAYADRTALPTMWNCRSRGG